MIQIERWEAPRCVKRDSTLEPLTEGQPDVARRFILFSPHETLNNNTDRNNNNSKRCCQNLTIRTFLPKNPHFYILLQKPKLRHFGSLLVRGKVSVSWAVVTPSPPGRRSEVLPRPHLALLAPRGQVSGAIYHCVCAILFIKKMRRLL